MAETQPRLCWMGKTITWERSKAQKMLTPLTAKEQKRFLASLRMMELFPKIMRIHQ